MARRKKPKYQQKDKDDTSVFLKNKLSGRSPNQKIYINLGKKIVQIQKIHLKKILKIF